MFLGKSTAIVGMSRCFLLVLCAWNLSLIANGFNINADGVTEHLFVQAPPTTVPTSFSKGKDETFFGYKIYLELINNGIENTIQLAVSAPTERVQVYTDSSQEQGGAIKEPNPKSRAAISPTKATGAMYYCEITQSQFLNHSAEKVHDCSHRAYIDRDLSGYEISDKDSLGMSFTTLPLPEDGVTVTQKNTLVACAPLQLHDCSTNHKAEGACYISEVVPGRGDSQKTVRWHKRVPCRDSCFERNIDLMFVLDGSFSVGNESFKTVKEWVKEVSNGFDIKKQVQIGVVQYSYFYDDRINQAYMKTEISLGQFKDKNLFDEAVDKIIYHGYSTYTAHAINKTVKEDFMGPTSRYPDARRVMILLTDGNADDAEKLPGATSFALTSGVESYAVGVSNYDPLQLELIAGSKERVITVEDFDDLSNVVSQLQRGIQIIEGSGLPNASNELTQCQAGISAKFDKTGALYLGAVGAYDWSGTIVKYDSAGDQVPDIPDFSEVQKVLKDWTKESYLGYSITSGFFNGGSTDEFVAIGAPRYKLKGAVVIYKPVAGNSTFTGARTIYPNNKNSQLGSYFGGTLLSLDLNSDGRDDLLVGAPLFIDGSYDDGRVYVYIAPSRGTSHVTWSGNPSERYFKILSGGASARGSRFGTAMASAGDLNADGYNDVIIGAPYANDNKGAVFVFHGSADGIDTTVRQIIRASDLPNPNLLYFGLSLQGGEDLDDNGYPDIAVGAPKSDTVVIFRSRPIVNFTGNLEFDTQRLDVFDCFATSDRDCLLLTACLRIDGHNVEPIINVDFRLDLDNSVSGSDNKRVEFREDTSGVGKYIVEGNKNFTKGRRHCWNNTVYVKQIVSDYSAPIEAVFTYQLSEKHQSVSLSSVRDPTILNQRKATTSFARDCGGDRTCNYDLDVDASMQLPSSNLSIQESMEEDVLIVSQQTSITPIIVRVNLTNKGENAFDVKILVNYTAQLSWSNMHNIKSSNNRSSLPCIDDSQRDSSSSTSRVKVLNYRYDRNQGNILPEENWCYFEFTLSSNSLSSSGSIPDIMVHVSAGTGLLGGDIEKDRNKENNQWVGTAPVRYISDASVQKRSLDTPVPFNFTEDNTTVTTVQGIGVNTTDIQVVYLVNGRGHSNIPRSTIDLSFPYRLPGTADSDMMHLLYLSTYSCMSTEGDAGCVCDEAVVNPYKLLETYPAENDTELNKIAIKPNPNTIMGSPLFDCSGNDVESSGTGGHCETLRCVVTDLAFTDTITFKASFRLWTPTLRLENNTEVTLRTGFRFSTQDSPLVTDKNGNQIIIQERIDSTARWYVPPLQIDSTDTLWIYIVAAVGGLLLLAVIVAIMWKVGFFKSKYADKKEQLEWNEAQGNEGMNGS